MRTKTRVCRRETWRGAESNYLEPFKIVRASPRRYGLMADILAWGIEMSEADFYGVPEFFISHVTTESAGNGNIRVFNYAVRGGIEVPQFTVVIAAVDLLKASRQVELAAELAFSEERTCWAVH